jgi:PII-like signaling protein
MSITQKEAVLLRIYVSEAMKWEHKPLYEAIVMRARESGLAGATVLRGPMGYGRSTEMHTAKILDLSVNLPILIELVDTEEKIDGFLPALNGMLTGGLATLEKVRTVQFGEDAKL